METYSTEEQVIGTWVDGKKIYRKVLVNGASSTSGEYSIDTSDLNIETFIKGAGIAKISANERVYNIPLANPWNSIFAEFRSSAKKVMLCAYSGTSLTTIYNVYLWIEYTKTTD